MSEGIRQPGETIDGFLRRHYAVHWIDGEVPPRRMERARQAFHAANPRLKSEWTKAVLPEIEGIPRIRYTIGAKTRLEEAMHQAQLLMRGDTRLRMLSFIDPLRLACEELGILFSPAVAADVRRRLEGQVSFNQEHYEEIRQGKRGLAGIDDIAWVHRQPGM